MKKLVWFSAAAAFALCAAAVSTYARYESFDPCVWMEQDIAQRSNLPRIVARGRIHAEFLLQGIRGPSPYQCLQAWWKVRAEGASRSS